MSVVVRGYEHESDYARVGAFLVRTYRASGSDLNWLAPRWEYISLHNVRAVAKLRIDFTTTSVPIRGALVLAISFVMIGMAQLRRQRRG